MGRYRTQNVTEALQTRCGMLQSVTEHYGALRDVMGRYGTLRERYGTLTERYGIVTENIGGPYMWGIFGVYKLPKLT